VRPEPGRSLYDVLGASPHATRAELAAAYRAAALAHHPDTSADPWTPEDFHAVSDAWRILGDPTARRTYDAALARVRERQRASASPAYRVGHTVGLAAGRATRYVARRLFG
jgi:DnaJ-class molecular chaperone